MSGILLAATGGLGFTPTIRNYTTGTGATETVPPGALSCLIEVFGGPGGGGKANPGIDGGGAGGPGYCSRTVTVTGGQTFTYTVGATGAGATVAGAGVTGGNSTVTSAAPVVSMTANGTLGGNGAGAPSGSAGGTASGGTTNTTGSAGIVSTGGSSGGTPATTGGAGGINGTNGLTSVNPGRVRFSYT